MNDLTPPAFDDGCGPTLHGANTHLETESPRHISCCGTFIIL
ncbi:MAG: hypothetical protein ACLQPD_02045 [Desulfomonilaceae bacterium]